MLCHITVGPFSGLNKEEADRRDFQLALKSDPRFEII